MSDYKINPHVTWETWGYNGYNAKDDDDWYNSKKKKKHEFVAILLLSHTVYDCKNCGRPKEKCKTEYCEDEK